MRCTPSSFASSRLNVPKGRWPALLASARIRQSEKPTPGCASKLCVRAAGLLHLQPRRAGADRTAPWGQPQARPSAAHRFRAHERAAAEQRSRRAGGLAAGPGPDAGTCASTSRTIPECGFSNATASSPKSLSGGRRSASPGAPSPAGPPRRGRTAGRSCRPGRRVGRHGERS
jgi:hypothetical protein